MKILTHQKKTGGRIKKTKKDSKIVANRKVTLTAARAQGRAGARAAKVAILNSIFDKFAGERAPSHTPLPSAPW